MSLIFLDNAQLYSDHSYYQKHFSWPRTAADSFPLIYHCYWSGILTRHHGLSLKSLLITQSPPFEVWIWMSPEWLARNQHVISGMATAPCIKFKEYVAAEEAKGTIYEGKMNRLKRRKPSDTADAFRLLVLGNYGGIYFDLDVLFLQDLRPLCNVEFFYQWSNQPCGNNALLHFRRQSPNIWGLAEHSINIRNAHPSYLFRYDEISDALKDVYVFPTFLFDPAWISHDTAKPINDYCNTLDDFFLKEVSVSLSNFFTGSYAYHWHNRWQWPIKPNTIVGNLYEEVDAIFKSKNQSELGLKTGS